MNAELEIAALPLARLVRLLFPDVPVSSNSVVRVPV